MQTDYKILNLHEQLVGTGSGTPRADGVYMTRTGNPWQLSNGQKYWLTYFPNGRFQAVAISVSKDACIFYYSGLLERLERLESFTRSSHLVSRPLAQRTMLSSSSSDLLAKMQFAYWKQIAQVVREGLNANSVFIPMGQYSIADIVNESQPLNNSQIYSWSDNVYGPLADKDDLAPILSGSYIAFLELWLSAVDLGGHPDPVLEKKRENAFKDLETAQKKFRETQKEALEEYNNDKHKGSMPFQQWVLDNYPSYSSIRATLKSAQVNYDKVLTEIYGVGAQQLQRYKDGVSNAFDKGVSIPGYNMPCADHSDAKASYYQPSVSIQADFMELWKGWIMTYSNDPKNSVNTNGALNFTLNYNKLTEIDWSSFKLNQSSYDGSVGFSDWFFSINGSGGSSGTEKVEGLSVGTTDDKFSVTVNFQQFTTLDFKRGAWDIKNITRLYPNLLSTIDDSTKQNWKDALSYVTTSVVVGFAPTITMNFSEETYNYVFKKYENEKKTENAGFSIFGIRIGGSGSSYSYEKYENMYWTKQTNGGTLRIGPISQAAPQVIALLAKKIESDLPLVTNSLSSNISIALESIPVEEREKLKLGLSDYWRAIRNESPLAQANALKKISKHWKPKKPETKEDKIIKMAMDTIHEICVHSLNVKDSTIKQNVVKSTCTALNIKSNEILENDPKLQEALESFFKLESN